MRLRTAAYPVALLLVAGCATVATRPPVEPPMPDGDPAEPAAGPGAEGTELLPMERPVPPADVGGFPEDVLPDPVLVPSWEERPEILERMAWYERLWRGRGAETFRNYLRRKGGYETLVRTELAERGLPESLVYLPIIESGYNPSAVSWAGAVGLWQLMSGTARDAGLTVTSVLDERRDPLRSTEVALDFIVYLYGRFESWPLTLAAYNGGPARVARLAARHAPGAPYGDSVYLVIRPHLPRETRDFLPKLMAAAKLASDPAEHGLDGFEPMEPITWDEVIVPDATSVDVLAAAAQVEQSVLERLNPQLVRGFTPAGRETVVRVPAGRGGTFAVNYAAIPPEERVTFQEHRVASGDTFWDVARAYGVPVNVLQAANPGISPTRLQIGQWLVIPRAPAPGDPSRVVQAESAVASAAGATHVVRRGETLWGIARRYGVGVSELRSWNTLERADMIKPGDRLRVQR